MLYTGDAYTYTLQPVFRNLGRQFRCHVRRRHPDTMYQLWFYVTVPGTDFETPRVHHQVSRQNFFVLDGFNFFSLFLHFSLSTLFLLVFVFHITPISTMGFWKGFGSPGRKRILRIFGSQNASYANILVVYVQCL